MVWGGLPFHRAAWSNLRHGAASMDTLVSIGTLAAFGWSLYALFLGGAGRPGTSTRSTSRCPATGGAAQIYLEVAAGVITFVLAGRYAEARPAGAPGPRCDALLTLAAKEAVGRCGTGARCGCRPTSSWSATGSWSGPARRSRPTEWSWRAPPRST